MPLSLLVCISTKKKPEETPLIKPLVYNDGIVLPETDLPNDPVRENDTNGTSPSTLSLKAFAQKDFKGKDLKIGYILAQNSSYTRHYITYKSGELTISGIMNIPRGDGPFPLLVLNHGYIDPAVYTNGRGLKREQDYLARQGYVIIHPDYRNHADSDKDPDTEHNFRFGYAEDVINAILAIKEANLPFVNTDKIGMLGHSMGGGVAWRVMVSRPDLVDAYVQFAPVSANERDNFDKWIKRRPDTANRIISQYGKPQDNKIFWDNISPENFFVNIQAPIMIHHGTADESVPLAWSEKASENLKAANKNVTFYTYIGEPHEFTSAWSQVMARTTDFFNQHLQVDQD